jgi:hypothetical protein
VGQAAATALESFGTCLISAAAGIIAFAVLGAHFAGAGMPGIALLSFAGGKVGADIVGGAIGIMSAKN